MPPEKINWRKFTHWLSPLLLVSLGLHGLVMLMPLPGKDEPIKDELPPPISVTELPKTAPKTAEPSSGVPPAAFVPGSAPTAVETPQRELIQPPSGVIAGSQPTPKPVQLPAPKPTQSPAPKPTPPPTNQPQTNQPRNTTGTTNNDKLIAGGLFASKYGKPEELTPILDLSYPAKGKCISQDTELAAAMGISVDKAGKIVAGELLQLTVAPEVNAWLLAYVKSDNPTQLPNDVFADLQQTNPAAPPDGYITDWVQAARNSTTSFVPTDKDQAPYVFNVSVTIEGNKCDP